MPKPSVYRQVEATAIAKNRLKDSPRHWNNGLMRFRGRLWMSYRYHLMSSSGRCKTAICPVDEDTLQPSGPSQMLDLPEANDRVHQEDARLFTIGHDAFVSYTEMTGYQPGVDFKCVMKYALLRLVGSKWKVEWSWQPAFGRNDGTSKEKNWVFFEYDKRIHAVYSGDTEHTVIEIDGDQVKNVYRTPGALWEWGVFRGGTPPVLMPDGNFMAVFHSSIPTEVAPHYVRYFAGAYTFESKPPFRVLGISPRPFLSGSEEDGHQVDPRYVAGWKPYVVFPCGLVASKSTETGCPPKEYLVSFGINDWQSAIARIPASRFTFVAPDGSQRSPRCFRREAASQPVKLFSLVGPARLLHWSIPVQGAGCSAGTGYIRITNLRDAEEVSELPGVEEISEAEFQRLNRRQSNSCLTFG